MSEAKIKIYNSEIERYERNYLREKEYKKIMVILLKDMKLIDDNMKRNLFIILMLFFSIEAYSICDSTSLIINIEKNDSIDFNIKFEFENVSNDTILLFTRFKNFRENYNSAPGIRFSFYRDHNFFYPLDGENPIKIYNFLGGRVHIPPKGKVKFTIDIRQYIWFPQEEEEYGVVVDINYRYYIMSSEIEKRQLYNKHLKTKYFKTN